MPCSDSSAIPSSPSQPEWKIGFQDHPASLLGLSAQMLSDCLHCPWFLVTLSAGGLWRLEVQNQGVCGATLPLSLWIESLPCLSPSFWWWLMVPGFPLLAPASLQPLPPLLHGFLSLGLSALRSPFYASLLPIRTPWAHPTPIFLGFPCGSGGKESTCNAGNLGSIPALGKSPGEGKRDRKRHV